MPFTEKPVMQKSAQPARPTARKSTAKRKEWEKLLEGYHIEELQTACFDRQSKAAILTCIVRLIFKSGVFELKNDDASWLSCAITP